MKITKRCVPGIQIWKGACRNCKSEAEAQEKELTHIEHCQREGSWSWEKCPVCGFGKRGSGYGGMLFYPVKE